MGLRLTADRNVAPTTEIEVFATGSTRAIAAVPTAEHGLPGNRAEPHLSASLSERIQQGGGLVREGIDHARDFRARPGPRPGACPVQPATTSRRTGGDTDIVRPVLVSPAVASELATSGVLFDDPIPHLSFAPRDDSGQRFLMWDAELETGGRRRRVTFHLLGSPSLLVTVLELVPCRRPRYRRQQFVTDGVAAVEVIARRLERAAGEYRSPAVGVGIRRRRPGSA